MLSRQVGDTVFVRDLRRSALGLSRDTWFVTFETNRDKRNQKWVLRADLEHGSACPTLLRTEYELYDRLHRFGMPVPAVGLYHSTVLGPDFYLREFVDGSPVVDGFGSEAREYENLQVEMAREHVRALARLHAMDWRGAAIHEVLEPPTVTEGVARSAVRRLYELYQAIEFEPSPFVYEVFEYLWQTAPAHAAPVSLLKGSNGYTQEVWRSGNLVALMDWELASIGDPASDIARCIGFYRAIGDRWNRETFLDYYESLTRYRPTAEAIEYYSAMFEMEMLIVCENARRLFRDGSGSARLAYLAAVSGPDKMRRLRARLATAT